MSRSEQSRLNEQRRRQAWKKRRDQHRPSSVVATISSRDEDRGPARTMPKSMVLPNGEVTKVVETERLGLPKMSEQIEELIDPFLRGVKSQKGFEGLVRVAVIAWNAEVVSKKERAEMLASTLASLIKYDLTEFVRAAIERGVPPATIDFDSANDAIAGETRDIVLLLSSLIQRRQKLFADDRRFIVEYWIDWPSEYEPYLRIASTVPPDVDIPDE
jgi:hypothetical protein